MKIFDGYQYKKLTVVSASTGYGKTVLISQFATQVDNPVVWYQLDDFDNDLTMFIRYFIGGISRNISHFGLQTLDFIDRHEDISKQIRSIVVLLANELEARAKEGLVFIFEDYHLINEILIHKFVEELIEYLPEGVHLVISSRYVLPLNLVRLKVHGLVNEITYDCLKFSQDEIPKEFIKKSPWFMLLKGVIYSYKGMWHEALIQIDRALEIFLSYGNQEDILNARFQKSSVLRRAGLLDESLALLNQIFPIVSKLPIRDWYDVILEKVNILLWNGCLNEAVKTLKKGIEFAQHDEEEGLIAYFMEHLGATYYATGDYYKAVEFYQASKERYLQVYNPFSEIEKERYSQRTTLARIYRDWGELEKALGLIREEIDTKERLGLIDDLPRAYHQLALIYNDLGQKEDAEKYFHHADKMYRKLDRKDFQWTWHLALYGKILIDNGKLEKGKGLIEKAIERAKENSDFNLPVLLDIGKYLFEDE